MEAAGETGQQGRQNIQSEAADQYRPPAEAVRYQPPKQLAAAQPGHVRSDYPLNVILVGHVQRANDDRKGRQHGVDGNRLGRHHRCCENHEFQEADFNGLALLRHTLAPRHAS